MGKEGMVVVVTGGAPYAPGVPYNTSAMVRDAMPDIIERHKAGPIKIVKYPHDIESHYSEVMRVIPELWRGKLSVFDPKCPPNQMIHIDLMLHIGMRRSENCYCFEKKARRDGYEKPGSDGVQLPPGNAERGGIWEGLPEVLEPALDIELAGGRVAKELPDIPSRVSDDANLFLCEFQFYSSLAELYKRKQPGKVEFLHIPDGKEHDDIQRGVKIASALITALLDGKDS